ncbi:MULTISPECIES: sensor histidine kinase [Gammaproteobacteria]|uniref:sensor histidine kinase n=1 Tax=Gammaproteobacteria TaxID=1236 RepID=UPI000DD0EC35|nr:MULTISPECIES: sensor histidine kinase [Gammaproteobacteria]RTE85586.1 sensor histidine kinase [Aliidiomarina sp. B3213]TCZ89556.1 sensor histidine kinase [Lysobacter sp. N42]
MNFKSFNFKVGADQVSGVFTVALVACIDIWLLWSQMGASVGRLALLALIYGAFAVLFFVSTLDTKPPQAPKLKAILIAIQFTLVCGIVVTTPNPFAAILLVIWIAQLPYLMSFRLALALSPVWSVITWSLYAWRWETDGVFIMGLLYFAFNVFALIMMEARKEAEFERERAEQANRELIAMQSLLQEGSKQEERLRIARDIHDLVGHHLTALNLQLQVLTRTVPENCKREVEQSHAIAKLLLADVREAVSDIRAHDYLDLKQAIEKLIDRLPGVEVRLTIPEKVAVLNLEQGMVLLRSVQEAMTNAIKHGRASLIHIRVRQSKTELLAEVEDNGIGAHYLVKGNGLTGMQERIHQLGGELTLQSLEPGFLLRLTLPLKRLV